MSNTPFTIVADACTRQLKYADIQLFPLNQNAITRGATTLEPTDDPRSNYRFNYVVSVNKRRLGTLGLKHFKAVVDKDLVAFRYDNPTLYRDHVADVNQFLQDFELTPANISVLEIAIDTNTDVYSTFLDCFNRPEKFNYHYSVTTLEKLKVAGEMCRDGSQNFTLYPHIAADKKLKIYDKSKDIAAKEKRFIREFHHRNGLDVGQTVYRIELTLTNSAFKSKTTDYVRGTDELTAHQFNKLTDDEKRGYRERVTITDTSPSIKDLRCSETLLALFYKYTNNLRAFSIKNGTTRPTRCQQVELLNIGNPSAPVGVEYFADQKKYKNQMTATYKTLLRHYYTSQNETYLQTANLLAKESGTEAELSKQLEKLAALRPLFTSATSERACLPL